MLDKVQSSKVMKCIINLIFTKITGPVNSNLQLILQKWGYETISNYRQSFVKIFEKYFEDRWKECFKKIMWCTKDSTESKEN